MTGQRVKPTARELQVFDLRLKHVSYRMIGKTLGISKHTVRTHMQNVCHKAGVASIKDLLANPSLLTGTPAAPSTGSCTPVSTPVAPAFSLPES